MMFFIDCQSKLLRANIKYMLQYMSIILLFIKFINNFHEVLLTRTLKTHYLTSLTTSISSHLEFVLICWVMLKYFGKIALPEILDIQYYIFYCNILASNLYITCVKPFLCTQGNLYISRL